MDYFKTSKERVQVLSNIQDYTHANADFDKCPFDITV